MASNRPLETVALLQRLHASGVEFVIVGGVAAITHGSAVTTVDLDVCAPLTQENARSIIQAFADANPRWRMRPDLPVITVDDHHLVGIKNLYLATDFGQLDVLGELPDVCSYEDLAARSVQVDFGELRCRLIDIDTLIAAKRQAGRSHDLRTIAFLEEIKRRQSGPQG
jgi:predicted nucleotidyltransferase